MTKVSVIYKGKEEVYVLKCPLLAQQMVDEFNQMGLEAKCLS